MEAQVLEQDDLPVLQRLLDGAQGRVRALNSPALAAMSIASNTLPYSRSLSALMYRILSIVRLS